MVIVLYALIHSNISGSYFVSGTVLGYKVIKAWSDKSVQRRPPTGACSIPHQRMLRMHPL